MKNKFYKISKQQGITINSYNTYRSDMGFQVYEVQYSIPGEDRMINFCDSYPPPEKGGQEKVLNQFEFELKNNKK